MEALSGRASTTTLRGSQTGVFAGVFHGSGGGQGRAATWSATGCVARSLSVYSGRVAYVLGPAGPGGVGDTVFVVVGGHCIWRCSHCARRMRPGAGRWGHRDGHPRRYHRETAGSGRRPPMVVVRPGAGAADGTAFAEGAGTVLARLADARRLALVLALVRGSAEAAHENEPRLAVPSCHGEGFNC